MSKIKVTIYDRQTEAEGCRYVAHTDSLCGIGHSHMEAIGDLLTQINRRVPKDFNFDRLDLEIRDVDYFGN